MTILTEKGHPVYLKQQKPDEEKTDAIMTIVDELIRTKVIEGTESEWNSPAFVVEKNGSKRSFRFIIDLRAVNKVTLRHIDEAETLEEQVNRLAGPPSTAPRYYAKTDLASAFFQIPLAEKHRHLTAFTDPTGRRFQFRVAPMGARNSVAVLSQYLRHILRDHISHTVIQVDDLGIWADSPEELEQRFRNIVSTLATNGVQLSPSKTTGSTTSIDFAGYHVSAGQVKVAEKKAQAMATWATPTTRGELVKFICFAQWMSSFVRQFDDRSKLLRHALRRYRFNGDRIALTEEELAALESIKRLLAEAPTLTIFDKTAPLVVYMDACATSGGSVLLQQGKVVAYHSFSMDKHQVHYTIREKELLSLVKVAKRFPEYFNQAQQITVYTDHESLRYVLTTRSQTFDRLTRWANLLSQYTIDFVYVPGRRLAGIDALSRALSAKGTDAPEHAPQPPTTHAVYHVTVRPPPPPMVTRSQTRQPREQAQTAAQLQHVDPPPPPPPRVDPPLPPPPPPPSRVDTQHEPDPPRAPAPTTEEVPTATATTTTDQEKEGQPQSTTKDKEKEAPTTTGTVLDAQTTVKEPAGPAEQPDRHDHNERPTYQIPEAWIPILLEEYVNDSYFGPVIPLLRAKESTKTPGDVRRRAERLTIDANGVIFNNQLPTRSRLAIPAGRVRDSILQHLHEKLIHPSSRAMNADISEQFFIPDLAKLCENLTRACHTCYTTRPRTQAYGLYSRHDVPPYPFHTIALDLAPGQPLDQGYDNVLVVIDELTKTVVYVPTHATATTTDIFQALTDRVFAYYGVPTIIKSDNGSTLVSAKMQELCRVNNITLSPSTVYYHTHIVERAVQELRVRIRASVDGAGVGWVNKLGLMQQTVNRTRATENDKMAPSERLFGYVLPVPLMTKPTLYRATDGAGATRDTGWNRPTFASLIDSLLESQAQLAKEHDQGRHPSKIGVGSQVAVPFSYAKGVATTWHANQVGAKARPLYIGPCTVLTKSESDNCEVDLGHGNKQKFHVSLLKPLDLVTKTVPRRSDQPEEILWPNAMPKVQLVTNRRGAGAKTKYLVHFWGQHEVAGRWLTTDQISPHDVDKIAEYDRRTARGIPSRLHPENGLDLSAPPGTAAPPADG